MGCKNSKHLHDHDQHGLPGSMKSNPLTEQEIQARIDAPKQLQTLEIGGASIRYAWVSQRGYYPESLEKDNQDCFMVSPSFGPTSENQAFFAVFDGHGKEGHHCARYARDHLGKNILEKLSRIPAGGVNSKSIKQALSIAHFATNEGMHAEKRFDDSLSGTTAISILFRGKVMYISNVGDSRAIIVSKTDDNRLIAKPLSSDQTPYRKDERERIKKFGARILSMDQIEGLEPIHENWGDLNLGEDIDEGGDPPRVWSPNGDYPGTAFTRSLGDLLAEECGVVPEPEILEREINHFDKYVVIASDGVFEFLTNQMVADMLARYSDPLDACKAVVSAAYNMWLQYEVRTDDITIIALYIDSVTKIHGFTHTSSFHNSPSANSNSNSLLSEKSTAIENMEARPVRRAISREKRKHMISLKDEDAADDEGNDAEEDLELSEAGLKSLITPKSEADESVILSAMRSNFLFQHLNATQRQAVVGVMKEVNVAKGEWIIKQGDAGDKFYIVDNGRYEVRVKGPPLASLDNIDMKTIKPEELDKLAGNVVHIYESGVDQHPGFGELSLMYGKPRAASVISLTDGKLWSLDRKIFRRVVLRPKDYRREIIRTLKKVELLKCLNINQLQRLADLLNEKNYEAKEMIIRQGEPGETFYLIEKGHCECSINTSPDNSTPPKVVMTLKDHSYFGERALLESKPRAANVYAVAQTKVLYIDKSAFEEVLGPLAQIIDEDRARREAKASAESTAAKSIDDFDLKAVITVDALGPLMYAQFPKNAAEENGKKGSVLTLRTLLLSEVSKGAFNDSVIRYVETSRILQAQLPNKTPLLPNLQSILRQNNAIHLVYETSIVSDLTSFVKAHSERFIENDYYLIYTVGCIVSALEKLHENGIIYRAVQPDSIYVDNQGKVVLVDYRFCKLGIYGNNNKTFTICGASDYLAPEQIAQTGHSFPVDLWGLGVLLYELSVGSHPFSSNTEVATYSKISSFGTKAFPALKFPDNFSNDIKSLINQLLVPIPEARIGASSVSSAAAGSSPAAATGPTTTGGSGLSALKKHAFFKSFTSWDTIHQANTEKSPIYELAQIEVAELYKDTIDPSLLSSFSNTFEGNLDWLRNLDL